MIRLRAGSELKWILHYVFCRDSLRMDRYGTHDMRLTSRPGHSPPPEHAQREPDARRAGCHQWLAPQLEGGG